MVAVLIEQVGKVKTVGDSTDLLSDDMRSTLPDWLGIIATLEPALPLPLTGKDFVTRAETVGRASMLALQILCDIEVRAGVQGLNTDWHARKELVNVNPLTV